MIPRSSDSIDSNGPPAGWTSEILVDGAAATVEKAIEKWPGLLPDLPLGEGDGNRLLTRMAQLRLVQDVVPGFVPAIATAAERPSTAALR